MHRPPTVGQKTNKWYSKFVKLTLSLSKIRQSDLTEGVDLKRYKWL